MMAGRKSINDFIKYFCKEYNVDLCHDKTISSCPCRFKIRSIEFCNFNQRIIDLNPVKEALKYKKFLKLICEKYRRLLTRRDILSKDIQIRMRDAVSDIERGKIKLGDIGYCTKLGQEVILLKLPEEKHFDTYHKFGVFPGDVTYKTFNGVVGTCPVACINKISKGNFVSLYEIEGKGSSIEEEINHLAQIGKRRGFRVNMNETKKGYKIEFFGDSQQEVDEFVHLCNMPRFY